MQRSTVASLLRSTQAYCGQLCEKYTFDHGIAYHCNRYPAIGEINLLREVILPPRGTLNDAFGQTERWFAERGLFCHRWAPADGDLPPQWEEFLLARNFRRRVYAAMIAVRWPEPYRNPDIRVLPARALRAAFRDTFLNDEFPNAPLARRLLAETYEERLNDPQFESFVALVRNVPAGRAALFQVGDFARVMDINVLPAFRDQEVERALLSQVLVLAKRLAMRNVCAQVQADDPRRHGWLEAAGFIDDGSITEFERDPPASNNPTGGSPSS